MLLVAALARTRHLDSRVYLQLRKARGNQLYLEQAVPTMEGCRLSSGADVVLSDPARYAGSGLEPGLYSFETLQEKYSAQCLDEQLFELYLDANELQNFLSTRLSASVCAAVNSPDIVIYGARIDYDPADCIVRKIKICTWYESTSLQCRRWSVLRDESVRIAATKSIFEKILEQYPNTSYIATKDVRTSLRRFVDQYDGRNSTSLR